jgi:hypothetical protein
MTSAEPAGQDEVHVVADVDTERADSGDIDRGIAGTLAGLKWLAEAGPAPGSAS